MRPVLPRRAPASIREDQASPPDPKHRVFSAPHGHWWGVAVDYYGGSSWAFARTMRELAVARVPIFEIRGCAYLEMLRAEQARAAIAGEVAVVVFLSSTIDTSAAQIARLATAARDTGCAVYASGLDTNKVSFMAVPVRVLQAMKDAEVRRYSNSAVVMAFNGNAENAGAPLASPWNPDGTPLVPGRYLTESEAFCYRLVRAGGELVSHPVEYQDKAGQWRTSVRPGTPKDHHPGSQFALCIPSYGSMDLDQRALIFALENVGMSVIEMHNYPRIDMARSWLTQRALELERGVFFLDHDIMFHPNEVLRLCEQALERKAVVAGAYCMRRSGRNIIGLFDAPEGSQIPWFKAGKTLPAHYTGLGFAAIPADLLYEVAERHQLEPLLSSDLGELTPWYALDVKTGYYAGEDVSFCNRVQDIEIELRPGSETAPEWSVKRSNGKASRVFIDSTTRLAHRGVYDYGIEDVGLIVPRMGTVYTFATESRDEAERMLKSVYDEPLEQKLTMQYGAAVPPGEGVAEAADVPASQGPEDGDPAEAARQRQARIVASITGRNASSTDGGRAAAEQWLLERKLRFLTERAQERAELLRAWLEQPGEPETASEMGAMGELERRTVAELKRVVGPPPDPEKVQTLLRALNRPGPGEVTFDDIEKELRDRVEGTPSPEDIAEQFGSPSSSAE